MLTLTCVCASCETDAPLAEAWVEDKNKLILLHKVAKEHRKEHPDHDIRVYETNDAILTPSELDELNSQLENVLKNVFKSFLNQQ